MRLKLHELGILCMLGKKHGNDTGQQRALLVRTMLRHLKQIWIAYHAPGMTAMLQLCYHIGASMACALQRIAGKHSTDAAYKKQMLRKGNLIYDV